MIILGLSLVVSFAILLFSADLVVRGAVAVALRFHISPLLIGLTIVAFGTSAPELAISAEAAWNNVPGIALGNVVGSNIANVLLVLGVPALIQPIATSQPTIRRNTVLMIAATALAVGLALDGVIGLSDGIVLFAMIVAFLVYSGLHAANGQSEIGLLEELKELEDGGTLPQKPGRVTLMLVAGLIGLPTGSYLLLDSATDLARLIGVPDDIIGLSLVALGTSLPELATSVAAALRGQSAVAIGNVIGSNLFNILAVLGVAGMIMDIPVPSNFLTLNLWVMLGTAALIAPFAFLRSRITRLWGAAFLLGYGALLYWNFAVTHMH